MLYVGPRNLRLCFALLSTHANTSKTDRVSRSAQPLWCLSPLHLLFQALWFLVMSKQVWIKWEKIENPTVSQANFHLFCERHLSWKTGKSVYPVVSRRLSTFRVPCGKQSLSSNSQCGHCKQRGWTQSESSETTTRTYSVCYFHGKKGARSARFTGGVCACVFILALQPPVVGLKSYRLGDR